MGDEVSVDLNALTTFAHELGDTADKTMDRAYGYGADLGGLANMMNMAAMSATEFSEAQSFTEYHKLVASSAQAFMADMVQGTTSLAAGAEVCAINYAGADQFNAAMLHKLTAGVDKDHPFGPMNFVLNGTATVTDGDVNDAFAPGKDNGHWRDNSGGTGTGSGSTPTPMSGDDKKKVDDEYSKLVGDDKKLIADGQAVDVNQYNPDNKPITLGKDDYQITVPADQTPLTPPAMPETH